MRPAATETSVPFVARLASFGDRDAFVTPDGVVSYADLAQRVDAVARRLGTTRRLVLVAGGNELEPIVTYLAALSAGHPVILVPGDNPGNLAAVQDAYDPDVVLDGGRLIERRAGTAHDLHPSLSLLLSTSGSTGSPKLVRLSGGNVQANAESIAEYLAIRPSDVAATTLPMHYCYGLSVINSHLLAGASLLLTSLSVVDGCFWDLFRDHRATTFAGVPYTFDLLDRAGFADLDLPHLRYVTQAGGRLAPATVRRYAELGRRRGWDLFVMYGQTEATARMAYLPPDLAHSCPSAIGVPVPGGAFRLEPLPELPLPRTDPAAAAEVGELVYTGENVMLGYAESPADLARGRVTAELRTGDVARRTPEGLFEIVGRRSRFAKVFGLRIDLDQVESVFAADGVLACCADGEDRLVVAVEASGRPVDPALVQGLAKQHFGLPGGAVQVCPVTEMPRLPTGKPDYRAIAALRPAHPSFPKVCRETDTSHGARVEGSAGSSWEVRDGTPDSGAGPTGRELCALFGQVLNRPGATEADTFVTLEGDSLSYVEMSIRLEQALGHLPPNWHVTPIFDLLPTTTPRSGRRSGLRSLETNVLLRALAIVLIVGTHANLFLVVGGAHVLLGVAGFNFGRFHLTTSPRTDRIRHLATSLARVVVPSVLWIGFAAVFLTPYTWQDVLLLNGVLGPPGWAEPEWHFWFIEALVYTLLGLTVLVALPAVDRVERRWSFWLPFGLALVGLLTRYEVVTVMDGDVIHRANVVFWLFALGWATVKATASWQRVLVSAVVVATVPGFFGDLQREAVVVVGMLLLVWVGALRVPAWAARAAAVLASASLYIYLAHWQIYPYLEDSYPFLATVLGLLGGVLFWRVATWATPYVGLGPMFRGQQIGHNVK
ncbi:MAG TPA: AMP-binding protein [Nocardioidaceae bacterium]|nr:AMP-binding protein [Nocardioidaceae bacterium]